MRKWKCKQCQREFDEFARATYREDFGDVDTLKCPKCGTVLYEGYDFEDLFEEIESE